MTKGFRSSQHDSIASNPCGYRKNPDAGQTRIGVKPALLKAFLEADMSRLPQKRMVKGKIPIWS